MSDNLIHDETVLLELQESIRPELDELITEAVEENTAGFRCGVVNIDRKKYYFSMVLSEAS